MARHILILLLIPFWASACQGNEPQHTMYDTTPIIKTEKEWLAELGPERYRILRQKGTEYPGTGTYDKHFKDGIYVCAGCGHSLFSSVSKFDAHCGWPSFDAAISDQAVTEKRDISQGMIRIEIVCPNCGGHLGHVFDDGPTGTGLRYCVNSLSMQFQPITEDRTESHIKPLE